MGSSRTAIRNSSIASSDFSFSLSADTKIVVDDREAGIYPDRFAVGGDRLVEVPLRLKGIAEIAVGRGEIGLDPDCLAEFCDRFVQPSLGCQDGSEVVMDEGEIRLKLSAPRGKR